MTYYTTVHRDEDQDFLRGKPLDPCTSHMVFDSGYDLEVMRDVIQNHPWKVLWVMEKCPEAKFGWKFSHLFGIPQ